MLRLRLARGLTTRLSELSEEALGFRHKSMYPQRERIMFSLANALREHELDGSGGPLSMEGLREFCYRGKLQDDEIEVLLSAAKPGADGLVDLGQFVKTVASELLPPPEQAHRA